MRILTVIFILVVCGTKCFSQDSINKIYFQDGKIKSFQIKQDSITIYEKSFYENGRVSGEGTGFISNGKFVAKDFKRYYESGELWYSMTDSLSLSYERDGQLYMKVQMINGIKNGFMDVYQNGELVYKIEYKNDLKNGRLITYNLKTNKISFEDTYKDGSRLGPSKHYDNGGKLVKELFYKDNCILKVVYYNKKGKITKILTDKMNIVLSEGKSADCVL